MAPTQLFEGAVAFNETALAAGKSDPSMPRTCAAGVGECVGDQMESRTESRVDHSAAEAPMGDRIWLAVLGELPKNTQTRVKNHTGDYRTFVEGVLWIAREDACWACLPRRFGSWRSVYMRFVRWNHRGVWNRVAAAMGEEDGAMAKRLLHLARRHTEHSLRRKKRSAGMVWPHDHPVES